MILQSGWGWALEMNHCYTDLYRDVAGRHRGSIWSVNNRNREATDSGNSFSSFKSGARILNLLFNSCIWLNPIGLLWHVMPVWAWWLRFSRHLGRGVLEEHVCINIYPLLRTDALTWAVTEGSSESDGCLNWDAGQMWHASLLSAQSPLPQFSLVYIQSQHFLAQLSAGGAISAAITVWTCSGMKLLPNEGLWLRRGA